VESGEANTLAAKASSNPVIAAEEGVRRGVPGFSAGLGWRRERERCRDPGTARELVELQTNCLTGRDVGAPPGSVC